MTENRPKQLIVFLFLITIQGFFINSHAESPIYETGKVDQGNLLVADAGLQDRFFGRTVILVIQRNSSGTHGLIINRPGRLKASDVWPQPDWSVTDPSVYFGGPVEMGRVRILFRHTKPPGLGRSVSDDIWLIEDHEQLIEYASAPVAFTETRIFVGYAGWAPGQLEMEIGRGDWHVIKGKTTDIFSTDPDGLWERLDQSLHQLWANLNRSLDRDGPPGN